MVLADRANRYIDQHKPWTLAKDPARAAEVRAIATQGINLFRVLMSYLAPVLPQMAQSAASFLGTGFERLECHAHSRCSEARSAHTSRWRRVWTRPRLHH